jgi:hypothetical protein
MVLPVMNRGGARTVRTLAWGFRSVAREHGRHPSATRQITLLCTIPSLKGTSDFQIRFARHG